MVSAQPAVQNLGRPLGEFTEPTAIVSVPFGASAIAPVDGAGAAGTAVAAAGAGAVEAAGADVDGAAGAGAGAAGAGAAGAACCGAAGATGAAGADGSSAELHANPTTIIEASITPTSNFVPLNLCHMD
ncbi:MAG: hypothetical protein QF898_00950 [SAR202 cluster bacterium]|nr:hypothetical protein [SAR202 cluster bacterium]MDP6513737.1 hypothetical protein [SAR202 cluster bacterium]